MAGKKFPAVFFYFFPLQCNKTAKLTLFIMKQGNDNLAVI